jgi:hypothetical protein
MSNIKQTLKFFSPLSIIAYSSHEYGGCGADDLPEVLSPSEAAYYMDEILAAIKKEKLPSEGDRGLMVYFYDDQVLSEKIYSLQPTVEEWNGKLWGVMIAEVYGELTEAETAKLLNFAVGQLLTAGARGSSSVPLKHVTVKSSSASGTVRTFLSSRNRS